MSALTRTYEVTTWTPAVFVNCGSYFGVLWAVARAIAKTAGPTASSKTSRNDFHHRPKMKLRAARPRALPATVFHAGRTDFADSDRDE